MHLAANWKQTLTEVLKSGTAYVPGALDDSTLQELLAVQVDWRQLDEQLPSGVYQQYSFAGVDPAVDAIVGDLCTSLVADITHADNRCSGLDDFVLNEASFHRYQANDAGLGPHRDMHFYRSLVVGITLQGSGELHLFDDDEQLTQVWHTNPGDLYLFRAPGLGGVEDGRPRHATGPTPGRTSLTLRYNQHGFGGGWGDAN